MSTPTPGAATRERILDAAAGVLLRRGLAHATTKEIARAANCSEALLYKYFPDKRVLLLAVLDERMPAPDPRAAGEDPAHAQPLEDTLVGMIDALLAFHLVSFPIAASMFGSDDLLAAHRERTAVAGGGPHSPADRVRRYLEGERRIGRVAADADPGAAARALAGAALLEAFLANYRGDREIRDRRELARRIVRTVLPSLEPR